MTSGQPEMVAGHQRGQQAIGEEIHREHFTPFPVPRVMVTALGQFFKFYSNHYVKKNL